MTSISSARYLELVAAIYERHYGVWYSIYPETSAEYNKMLGGLLTKARTRLRDVKELKLRGPEKEFIDQEADELPPLRGALFYLGKIALSIVATAVDNYLVRC